MVTIHGIYSPFDGKGNRATVEMPRAGAIRDVVLWRDELRHSIGNWVIPKSNQQLHCKCEQFAFLVGETVVTVFFCLCT